MESLSIDGKKQEPQTSALAKRRRISLIGSASSQPGCFLPHIDEIAISHGLEDVILSWQPADSP
jgi:hypothetical protein